MAGQKEKIAQEFVHADPFDVVYPDGSYTPRQANPGEQPVKPDVDAAQVYLDSLSKEMQQNRAARVNDHIAGLLTFMKKTDNPSLDVMSEFGVQQERARLDPSYSGQRAEAQDLVNKQYTDAFSNVLKDTTNPELVKESLKTAGTALTTQENLLHGADIGELFTASMSMSPDDKKVAEQTFQINGLKTVSDLLKDQSFIDKVSNWAGMLFLSDTGIDMSRVVGTSILDSGEGMESFINKFRGLPAPVKSYMWPQIVKAIDSATDKNNYKTARALMSLLDPAGGAEMHHEINMSNAFLGFDVVTFGASIATKLAKVVKAANMVRALKTVEATSEAADLSVAVGLDKSGEIGKAAGIDAHVSAINASPFKMSDIMPEATDGITSDSQHILKQIELGNNETNTRLNRAIDNSIKDGLLYEREKSAVQIKAMKALDQMKEETFAQHGWDLTDVKIANSSEDGFTLTYSLAGVPVERKIMYKLSDVGEMVGVEEGKQSSAGIMSTLLSPDAKLATVDKDLVPAATRIELRRAKILDTFTKEVNRIGKEYLGNPLNPLNRTGYKKVDDILLAGDDFENAAGDYGKVYSWHELTEDGIRLRDDRVVKLSEKEAMAYYRLRNLFDNAWVMKNKSVRQALRLNGMKEVVVNGVKTIAKDFETAGRAVRSMEDAKVHTIFDPTAAGGEGAVVRISQVDAEDLYSKGYKIVKFHRGSQEFGHATTEGKFASHAIVKAEDVGELPLKVIHYKKGYVPKMDKNGYWFVKEPVYGELNGVKGARVGNRTLRIFDNKREADKYTKALMAKNPGSKYDVLHDRQMAQEELADEAMGVSGGLYTSPRSTHPIVFGADGVARPRVSAYQSLQRNLQHLSNLIPRNEWRIGAQQRWLNTAYEMYSQTGVGLRHGEEFHAAIRGESHTKAWRALNESRKYIEDQLRIPTNEEKIFSDVVKNAVTWAEGAPGLGAKALQPVRNAIMSWSSKDPYSLARSATFNALLGWFNPAQLLVQAQGFSVAFGLHPEHWGEAVRTYPALRALMHVSEMSEDVLKNQAKVWSKITGLKEADLLETMQIWAKSGLQESIKSTADHAAAVQSYGFTQDAFRRLTEQGLVFYREGEYVNRAYAVATARAVWRKANPKAVLDAVGEKEIIDYAMRLQLNLTRANRASWQRGLLSLPTQFMQIQTKFIEALAGHSFTPAQKAKLLGIQFGLYGGAGIVGGNMFVNSVANMAGVRPEDMTPELKRWARGGLLDMMAYTIFGADVSIGKRGAITSGLEQTFTDIFIKGTPLIQSMAGAFGSGVGRTAQAFKTIYPLITTAATGDMDLTADDYKFMANEFGKVVSTWRNIDKALFLHRTGMAITGRGSVTVDDSLHTKFNSATLLAQAMGIQPSLIEDVYTLQTWEKNEKSHLDARVQALMNVYYNYASRDVGDREHQVRATEAMKELLMKDLNPTQRQYIMDKLHQRVSSGKSTEDKVVHDLFWDAAIDINNSNASLPTANVAIPNLQEQK